MEEKNIYADLGKRILISSVFAIFGSYAFSLLLFLYPMWYLKSSVKNGIVPTVIAMAISAVLISLGTSYMMGLTLFFTFVPMLLAFHYCVDTKKNYLFTLAAMSLALFASAIALEFGQLSAMGGVDLTKVIDDLVNVQISSLGEGMTSLELSRIEDTLRSVYMLITRIMPGILAVICIIASYINYLLAGRQLLREGVVINQPPLFFNIQVPRSIMAFSGAAILTVIALMLINADKTNIFAENLLVVFGFIFFANGLATLSNFMIRFGIPTFLRVLVYFVSLIFYQVGVLVILLGLGDSMLNLRRIGVRKE